MLHNMQLSYPSLSNAILRQPNGTVRTTDEHKSTTSISFVSYVHSFAQLSSLPGTLTTSASVASRRGSVASFPDAFAAPFPAASHHAYYSLNSGHQQPAFAYHKENRENANRTLKYKNVVKELEDARL